MGKKEKVLQKKQNWDCGEMLEVVIKFFNLFKSLQRKKKLDGVLRVKVKFIVNIFSKIR